MEAVLVKMAENAPVAVALIVVFSMFIARMRESQKMGHEVAESLMNRYEANLKRMDERNERVETQHIAALQRVSERVGVLSNQIAKLVARSQGAKP